MQKKHHFTTLLIATSLLVLGVLFSSNVQAAAIECYVNDFGTVAQRTVGAGGDWDTQTVTWGTANIVPYENGWNSISLDLDGDALHYGMSANSRQQTIWIKKLELPYARMKNITITAHGHGHPSHGASFGVGLSLDGITWDQKTANGAAVAYPDITATLAPTDAAYQNIDEVYISIVWSNGNYTVDQPWYSAYITDVTVTAIPEPASFLLLLLGGLPMFGRYRRGRK
ncbi:MAG: PEP-CTERM sorting domain-containing protein [Candidatus Pacebacteria bacterium]|nr:PEP-CTERM sorting domain-containing protein [Candidatus Paceibacterota bacterium]